MSEKLTKCPACWAVHPASNTYLHVCPVETSSGLRDKIAALTAERDALAKFKAWVGGGSVSNA